MSFLDQWRAQIPSAVSQMLSQFTQDTIVSCEVTATATLWPIRQQIKSYDAEAIDAIGQIIPSQRGTILRLVASWPETILDAIEMTREAARDTDTLAALITIIRFFQADAVFIQQFQITPSQSVFYGEVKAALLSTGTLTIGQLHLHITAPEKEPLPPPTIHGPQAHFIGRDKEVEELVSLLETSGETGNTVVIRNDLTASIATVTGLGGVGKTELSRAVANRVQETFPDGQILVNLYGSRTTPLPVTQALQEILYAFLGESKLPEQQGELELLYRRVLADKRVLIVADDARDAAHVKALMPPQGSALLITSRYRFGLPGMHLVELKRLAEPDAIRLLQEINPAISDEQAKTLAQLCGNLPLALRAAAGILKRGKPIEAYIHLVRNEKERIRRLSDKRSDLDVEAVLSSSYSLLTPDEKVVLQQLGVFVASFDPQAYEAVVACDSTDPIDLIVDELRDTNLVEYDPESNRYSLHELVRVFALNLLEAEQKEATYLRYVGYAIAVASEAQQRFLAGEQLHGLALFDRERSHIDESRRWLYQHEISETIDQFIIADAGATSHIGSLRYLNASSNEFPHLSRINQFQRALEASQQQTNRQGEANCLGNLGSAYLGLGEVHKAIDFYQQSLTIKREIHDRRGEAGSLGNLGLAYADLGEVHKAIDFYQQQLVIVREIHDRRGEADTHWNLGIALIQQGNTQEGLSELRQGHDFYQGMNHPQAARMAANIEYIQVHGKLPIQQKSPIEQQIAMALAQAEQVVEQVLANPQIDRRILAQQLEEAAQHYEADEEEGSPWLVLATQLRHLASKLQMTSKEQKTTTYWHTLTTVIRKFLGKRDS
jgi:tetratricopeptide (TPR) repeat protein